MTRTSAPVIVQHGDGSTEGADPRELPLSALEAAGHKKRPLLSAIREKCLDCCAGQPTEVRRCTAVGCALWPFRMASNPFAVHPGNPGNFRRPG